MPDLNIPRGKRRRILDREIVDLLHERGPSSAPEVATAFKLKAHGNVMRRLDNLFDAGVLVRRTREREPGERGTPPVLYSVRT